MSADALAEEAACLSWFSHLRYHETRKHHCNPNLVYLLSIGMTTRLLKVVVSGAHSLWDKPSRMNM